MRTAQFPGIQSQAYDPVARTFHWLTVLLVAAEYTVGWTMPDIRSGTKLSTSIDLHLALGSALLIVVALRVGWRLTHQPPPAALPVWQQRFSRVTHVALYAILILMPLAGWASASAREWPVRAFGLLPLPALVALNAEIGFELGDVHALVMDWVLPTLLALHIGAAMYHRFVKCDSILSRMLPGR
jgi:cytochrome b561